MSADTPEPAHDPATQTVSEEADDEMVVVVCPRRVRERIQPELEEGRAALYERYEQQYQNLLAERTQLEDEVGCLERQLERKQAQLDAVVTRNERILEDRTESFRRTVADHRRNDDTRWTGTRQKPGLLARVRNWLGF